ncbi:MAG: preprotein translocase subunit YajC [Clostridia bacterium]|nr:preprotein translocase subunit YajC [Clostridia bacterium]
MLWKLLTTSSDSSSGGGKDYSMLIMIGVFALVLIVFMVFSKRSQKKKQQEVMETLSAIQPGNKVKTIGGICGIVVEVCDDNTFVLETGTEASGKSYLKFDKQAVYQTDAVKATPVATQPAPETEAEKGPAPAQEVFEEETSAEEKTEE